MSESTQKQVGRIRAPRVHITYDVETGGDITQKELPFVAGVIADLSGSRRNEINPYKERSFVDINPDNFDEVLDGINPTLDLQVEDKISGEQDKTMKVELDFHNMEDFSPEKIVKQVPTLNKLLEARSKLNDLAAKLDGNDKLNEILSNVFQDEGQKTALMKELENDTDKKDQ